MDLAIGAKRTWVMMEHVTKDGQHKLVDDCTYPLTGMACVSRIYTDLAVIDVTAQGFVAIELVPGLDFAELAGADGCPIADGRERNGGVTMTTAKPSSATTSGHPLAGLAAHCPRSAPMIWGPCRSAP